MYILSDDDDDEFSPGNNIEVASDCGLCGWSKLDLQRFRLLVRERALKVSVWDDDKRQFLENDIDLQSLGFRD